MDNEALLKLEGLHTIETIAEALGITRQSALNLVSKLKKQGHVTTSGGGRKKRLYKITARKQRPRKRGMFDIINKHSPMKLNPWYDHQVHGRYGPEEALIDAIQTRSFRAILASLRLFNHITNWPRLYKLAKEQDCWQKVGALYDLARMHFKVRKMPQKYQRRKKEKYKWKKISTLKNRNNFPEIQGKWHVYIPFNKKDLVEVA